MKSIRLLALASLFAACVSKPEATRDGGVACVREEDCNRAPLCGPIHLCVEGYCAEDTTFRACPDRGYSDAGMAGECVTYVGCNTRQCGALIACNEGRCDPMAPAVVVPCDAGAD